MITVEQARQILAENPLNPGTESIFLREASGRILAEGLVSPSAVPPFDNSAMDGYAFAWKDFHPGESLKLRGEVAAGDDAADVFVPGTAVRIFTGAMVPEGADTVVMQEKVNLQGDSILIADENLKCGANVRKAGSQTLKGQQVLAAGHLLTPGTCGFLASLGIDRVMVYRMPKVSVVVTGNEIIPPGQELQAGQVYECNSYSLLPALKQIGIHADLHFARDNREELEDVLLSAMQKSDVLIVTGGVSVGDYDLVVPALTKLGVETLFHRLKQKPAKPFYFGKKGSLSVFGMPGNPASVLTGWYAYVQEYLTHRSMQTQLKLANPLNKKPGMTLFAKGKAIGGEVTALPGQESYRMDAFADANCLIELPAESEGAVAGEWVKVNMF